MNKWDPSYIGEVMMDPDFDLSPKEAQQSLLDFCSDLVSQDFVADEIVRCWTTDFAAYLATLDKQMPLEPEEFKELIYKWATEVPTG